MYNKSAILGHTMISLTEARRTKDEADRCVCTCETVPISKLIQITENWNKYESRITEDALYKYWYACTSMYVCIDVHASVIASYETSYELLMNRKSGLSKVVTASYLPPWYRFCLDISIRCITSFTPSFSTTPAMHSLACAY